jgi:hypothetical protein
VDLQGRKGEDNMCCNLLRQKYQGDKVFLAEKE